MENSLEYYRILNIIKPRYLIDKTPYDIMNNSSISLTYDDIYLNYIKDQNLLVDANKPKKIKGGGSHVTIYCF